MFKSIWYFLTQINWNYGSHLPNWTFRIWRSPQLYGLMFYKSVKMKWCLVNSFNHMNDANINKAIKGYRAFLSGGIKHHCTYYFYEQYFMAEWSVKKHCIAKALLAYWDTFLYENNHYYESCKFSYKSAFILLIYHCREQKQGSSLQQVGGLVTRNISVFRLLWVTFYFKGMPILVDFHKGISLHVYPVCIVVSWIHQT